MNVIIIVCSFVSLLFMCANALDYQSVYDKIALALPDKTHDDGSLAPILIRLAWHQSGTFNNETLIGGPVNASMRFPPERDYEDNSGLQQARDILSSIRDEFGQELTFADLWSLSGVCAVQEMRGPKVPWRPGRVDQPDVPGARSYAPANLPHGDNPSPDAIRQKFRSLGFVDSEAVALIGAHSVGRAHKDTSGYSGAWTRAPTRFTNGFFNELLNNDWIPVIEQSGKRSFTDAATKTLFMLPSDLALLRDKSFRFFVESFSKDRALFFRTFSSAFSKLLELGVSFPSGVESQIFATLRERGPP